MMELVTLGKCTRAEKYGSCDSCGYYEDRSRLSRITITNTNGNTSHGNSICLCDDCAIKLRDLLNYIEISNLIKRGGIGED